MLQRIRKCFSSENDNHLDGNVEVDETYIGGKNKNRHASKKTKNAQGRSTQDKTPVVGLIQRHGKVTAHQVENTNTFTLTNEIIAYVKQTAELYTDEWLGYNKVSELYSHLVPEITSQDTLYQWRRQYVRANRSNVSPTLTANMGTGGHNVPLLLTDDGEIRKLTPHEAFNVQGYPEDFKLPKKTANSQLYKQAGNSVIVPVIHRIAENIMNVLSNNSNPTTLSRKSGAYALIYNSMDGRYAGESYVVDYANDVNTLKQQIKTSGKPILTDDEYLKFVKNKKNGDFYMIEEC